MDLLFLVLVQWGHVMASIVWFGGNVFLDFVVWRALLERPGGQAAPVYALINRYAAPVMAGSGTVLGPIQSLDFLFGTAYGRTWLVALVLTVGLMGWGATWHGRRLGPIWEGDAIRPGARARLRTGTTVELTGFALVLTCMILM